MIGYNFLKLMFDKITSRSYGYFSKFTFYLFEKNDSFDYIKNYRILPKKHKEFSGLIILGKKSKK
jgi:hypothetical protein